MGSDIGAACCAPTLQTQEQLTAAEAEVSRLTADRQRRESVEGDVAELTARSEAAEARANEASTALAEASKKLSDLQRELDGEKARASGLVSERNSFRNKAESLSREVAKHHEVQVGRLSCSRQRECPH